MRKILLTLLTSLFAITGMAGTSTRTISSFSASTGNQGALYWAANGTSSNRLTTNSSGNVRFYNGGATDSVLTSVVISIGHSSSGTGLKAITAAIQVSDNGSDWTNIDNDSEKTDYFTYSGTYGSATSAGVVTAAGYNQNGKITITMGSGHKYVRVTRGSNNFHVSAVTFTLSYSSGGSSYSITYNCDGGTVCPSTVASATTLPNPLPSGLTKSGYAFAGWFTDADKTVAAVAGASIAANTTLYAKWTPTYTVTYNGNGNTGGAAPTDGSSPYTAGSNVTVLGNTGSLVKTGYTFDGWNTAPNGSGTNYAVGATISSIAANTTLYAKWVEDSCTDPGLTITLN